MKTTVLPRHGNDATGAAASLAGHRAQYPRGRFAVTTTPGACGSELAVVQLTKKPRIPNTIRLADGRRVVCRIFDNGGIDAPGGSADRYTIAFKGFRSWRGGMVYPYIAADEDPYHPQGIGQHGEARDFLTGAHLGKRVAFEDLPEPVRRAVLQWFAPVRAPLKNNPHHH